MTEGLAAASVWWLVPGTNRQVGSRAVRIGTASSIAGFRNPPRPEQRPIRMRSRILTLLVVGLASVDDPTASTPETSGSSAAQTAAQTIHGSPVGFRCGRDLLESRTIHRASGTFGAPSALEPAAVFLGLDPTDSRLEPTTSTEGRVRVLLSPDDILTTYAVHALDDGTRFLAESVDRCA